MPPSKDDLLKMLDGRVPTLDEVKTELARRYMREYVKQAWPWIEPGRTFVSNWHIDAICDHLQAVVAHVTGKPGGIRKLAINIPPRHMKSLTCGVSLPTWAWIDNPHVQFLYASYAAALSIRDSIKCRRLIQSPWYQERFGASFQLTGDQNQKQRYDNDRNGYRLATSVDGGLTGEGGDIIVIDDPHNVRESESDAVREGVLEWWDQAMSTRLNDARKGAYIVVMQRVHEADLVGHIMSNEDGWDHLVLPAEYERKPLFEVRSSIGFKDPRTEEGELLWPARFPRAELEQLKQKLGSYGTASQLQQRPAPAGGGLIRRDHFKLWPADKGLPQCSFIVQSYDTAFTDKTSGDPTACTTWGVFKPEINPANRDPAPWCVIMLDGWTEHLSYPDLRRKAINEYHTEFGDPPRMPDVVLIEDKGSGQALKVDMARAGVPIRTYNPHRADKTMRVQIVLPLLEAGRVYLPESRHRKDAPCSWCEPLLKECTFFPHAEHDDLVDTMTQVLIMLHDSAFLAIDEQDEETWARPKKRVNPYAA